MSYLAATSSWSTPKRVPIAISSSTNPNYPPWWWINSCPPNSKCVFWVLLGTFGVKKLQQALFGAIGARRPKALKKHSVGHFPARAPGHSRKWRPGSQGFLRKICGFLREPALPKCSVRTVPSDCFHCWWFGDKPHWSDNKRQSAVLCMFLRGFLQFPAKICGFLRESALPKCQGRANPAFSKPCLCLSDTPPFSSFWGSEERSPLGIGRNTVSRVLFRRGELTEFCGKLGEFCQKLGEFAFAHK